MKLVDLLVALATSILLLLLWAEVSKAQVTLFTPMILTGVLWLCIQEARRG